MHPEVLTVAGKKVFPRLRQFKSFYLAGGTALALQLGHRVSVDFDLFSEKPIKRTLLKQVEKVFSDFGVSPQVNTRQELTILANGVKVTFLHYPFARLKRLINFNGQDMLNVKELAATKAYTVGRRGELKDYKDYLDIYFVLAERTTTLEDIISIAQEKYGSQFNARLFLEQLVYLDDVENAPVKFLSKSVGKNQLLNFFSRAVAEFKF